MLTFAIHTKISKLANLIEFDYWFLIIFVSGQRWVHIHIAYDENRPFPIIHTTWLSTLNQNIWCFSIIFRQGWCNGLWETPSVTGPTTRLFLNNITVCACVCVCERENERERMRDRVKLWMHHFIDKLLSIDVTLFIPHSSSWQKAAYGGNVYVFPFLF